MSKQTPTPFHASTTITLSPPVDGVETITMRVPTRLDMKKAQRAAKTEEEQQDVLLASLCDVEIHTVEALQLHQYAELVEALDGYTKKPASRTAKETPSL